MRACILILTLAASASAQPPQILNTLAGGNGFATPANGPATSAALISPSAVAVDNSGNIFVSDLYFSQVFKITPGGTLSLFAGTGTSSYSGDGGKALQATFSGPVALAFDPAGNLYMADEKWYVVRQVNSSGMISTFAGSSTATPGAGVNGPASGFGFAGPDGIAADATGDIYIADNGQGSRSIEKVSNGTISKVAGQFGFHGVPTDGPAANSPLTSPTGLAVDSGGNLFFTDTEYCGIWEINTSLTLSNFAGNGTCGFTGDGAASGHALNLPSYLAFSAPNSLYVSDVGNQRIRQISAGRMTTVAGTGVPGYNGDGMAAASAQISGPEGIAADTAGNVYFAEITGRRVRKIDAQGIIHTVAGVGASLPLGDGGPATAAVFITPVGVVSDGNGTFYVSDASTSTIRKITPDGKITTVAGTGLPGYNGDNIPAKQAQLNLPFALALDSQKNLYFSDTQNERVRMIDAQGNIQTVAGTGTLGYNGDNMAANQAQLGTPRGITFDSKGNLYIAEADNHRLRMVSNGIITTIAGINAQSGLAPETDSGDGLEAATASFVFLWGVAVDSAGNIYTADHGTFRVRKIGTDGIIRPFAGQTYDEGVSGDGGFSTNSLLDDASQVAVDSKGDVFITGQNRIREVTIDGIIHTPIGGGTEIGSGNGQLATSVNLTIPGQVWPAPDGTAYVTSGGDVSVFHFLTGQISREGVQNVADFSNTGAVSPGEILVMYGSGLGPATLTPPAFPPNATAFPTQIANTQVLFDGTAAPLFYVQSGIVALAVPFEIAGQSLTHVQVSVNGTLTNEVDMRVTPYTPGIWKSAVNADGHINSASNPANRGDIISFYVTGGGQTTPPLTDGQFVNDNTHLMNGKVQVLIGNELPPIIYAGAAPGSVAGQMQIVFRIPTDALTGSSVGILMLVGGQPATLGYTIAVQ